MLAFRSCETANAAVQRSMRRMLVRVQVVVNTAHYGLVLNILLVNCLIGTSFVQIYYRVYFV